jgi:superfamily II RNA helicase
MDGLSPEDLAGFAGAIAAERSARSPLRGPDIRPLHALARELDALERRYGIEPSNFSEPFRGGKRSPAFSAAAVASRWAGAREEWSDLVDKSGMEEGDLQRLILQTAEILRELEGLPLPVAEQAAQARLFLLREPVFDFSR